MRLYLFCLVSILFYMVRKFNIGQHLQIIYFYLEFSEKPYQSKNTNLKLFEVWTLEISLLTFLWESLRKVTIYDSFNQFSCPSINISSLSYLYHWKYSLFLLENLMKVTRSQCFFSSYVAISPYHITFEKVLHYKTYPF